MRALRELTPVQNLIELQRWLYGGATEGLHTMATSTDPSRLLGAMGFAVLFGILHAMMPGHGKSVLVTYHLGPPGHVLGGVASSVLLVLTHVGMAVVLVLTGFMVVQRTFVGAGRNFALETTSSVLIILIGLWLFVRSLRGHHHDDGRHQGRFLSIAAGFVPCPLTTFIMVYALAHGMVIAGLLVTLAMASGMVLTITAFAVSAVLLRTGLFHILNRRKVLLHRASQVFETGSALAVMGTGVWLQVIR
jgi:ABC-type nickel/cobalt efflux system permease component RcnA